MSQTIWNVLVIEFYKPDITPSYPFKQQNHGELRGKSEIEMEVWNQCTRLIASIIHYYNAHILNSCYVKAQNDQERQFLSSFSPTAQGHINLLGYYQFYATSEEDWLEKALHALDWRKNMNFVGES